MKIYLVIITLVCAALNNYAQQKNQPFIWGVASAAYQVEGAYQADGKGLSNWDVYTNDYHVTEGMIGENQTGNVSINQYDRKQYLQDIALMKKLGVNTYRFSLSWARLIPEGTGKINQKGIDHYITFIDDLTANGIEPMVTLYHWDMPQALQEKGGWLNPLSVQWFEEYSNLVFKSFGNKVKKYITFNEPYIENFLFAPLINNVIDKKNPAFLFTNEQMAERATATHHLLLANAKAINNFHQQKRMGIIGITLSLSPSIPLDVNNAADVKAAILQDGMHNRWFLDPIFKGTYPADVLTLYQQYNKNFIPTKSDYALFKSAQPDFLGINFYAPAYVSASPGMAFDINAWGNNPDSVKMFNGPVRPAYLYKLLMRIKEDYGNPLMIITENGAGFGDDDEQLINGSVKDQLRVDYVKRHIDTAMQARKDGANLQGYTLWSIFDNFEWISGYKRRFGIVHVNFETQERTPKQSYFEYQKIINQYRKTLK